MAQNLVPLVLFTMAPVGTLEAYSMRRPTDTHPIDNYYWRDAASPDGFGPFESLQACMNHYTAIAKFFKTDATGMRLLPANTPKPANVIQVDFKNKRRIP